SSRAGRPGFLEPGLLILTFVRHGGAPRPRRGLHDRGELTRPAHEALGLALRTRAATLGPALDGAQPHPANETAPGTDEGPVPGESAPRRRVGRMHAGFRDRCDSAARGCGCDAPR